MKSPHKIILYLFVSLILMNAAMATQIKPEVERYFEYRTDITVKCDAYRGFVKTDLPERYLAMDSPELYMSNEVFIEQQTKRHLLQDAWYVVPDSGMDVDQLPYLTDENSQTSMTFQNDSVMLSFKNPRRHPIDIITFQLLDSTIEGIEVKVDGEEVAGELYSSRYSAGSDDFYHEFRLRETISGSTMTIELNYEEVIRIEDIKVYEVRNENSEPALYININSRMCNQTMPLYFGETIKEIPEDVDLGFETYRPQQFRSENIRIPVTFPIEMETYENPDYVADWDNDSITNAKDNCVFINNTEQKDIDYDQQGDACQDWDGDGVLNAKDNCINVSNPQQDDEDADGMGNACDPQDDRFLEQNLVFIYLLGFCIALIFVGLSYRMLKK